MEDGSRNREELGRKWMISPDGYFDEEVERISREEFYEKMKTKADYAVYVCELEPPC
jgi:hypothetical protein